MLREEGVGGGGGTGDATEATAENILNLLERRSSRTSANGTTSGIANTWTEVFPSDITRGIWSIQISFDAVEFCQIGIGGAGSEIVIAELLPGSSIYESLPNNLTTERISIRSPLGVSEPFIAYQGIGVEPDSVASGGATQATLQSIEDVLYNRTSRISANGTTDITPNTWVELFPANALRTAWSIQNSQTSTDVIEVGDGGSGSEIVIAELIPGAGFFENLPNDVNPDRISLRSASASQTFIAWES